MTREEAIKEAEMLIAFMAANDSDRKHIRIRNALLMIVADAKRSTLKVKP